MKEIDLEELVIDIDEISPDIICKKIDKLNNNKEFYKEKIRH
jgi:hypothetical protein